METNDANEMVGLPAKYRLLHPENCDETGSTTNQKEDSHVGGELFIMPLEETEGACICATTDICFTVLVFTSGTGDPVMCAILLKSALTVDKLPITWKTGINVKKMQTQVGLNII